MSGKAVSEGHPALRSLARTRMHSKLLIVDGSPEVGGILELSLRHVGYDVDVATDGNAARRIVRLRPPTVVIMEHPEFLKGGRALLTWLHATPELEDVRILILSSRGMERDDWLEKYPCDAYLRKPVRIAELLRMVHLLAGRAAEAPPAPKAGGPPDPTAEVH